MDFALVQCHDERRHSLYLYLGNALHQYAPSFLNAKEYYSDGLVEWAYV